MDFARLDCTAETKTKTKDKQQQLEAIELKSNQMKTYRLKKKEAKAFTLIEMIGVLAVIAILAALLIPKIFEAINNARVNNALVSYNTVKTAVMDHYAKYGAIDRTTNGATIPAGTSPGIAAVPVNGLAYYDGALLT